MPEGVVQCESREQPGVAPQEQLMTASLDRPSALLKKRPLSAPRGSTQRPILYSENSCGTLIRNKQRTNHLTVECLVSVRAQVLIWDDALVGWLPVDEGALCGVSLLQQITCQQSLSACPVQPTKRSSWSDGLTQNTLAMPSARMAPQWEYHIQGKRIADQVVLLNCTLLPHVTYHNALPTFHHWRVNEHRFGLSFGSAFDAAKFSNRLQKALDHLSRQSKSSSGESNLDASEDLEDDVFAPVELPESISSSSTILGSTHHSTASVIHADVANGTTHADHAPLLLPAVALQYPIPTIHTSHSSSSLIKDVVAAVDECPPMDPETARVTNAYQNCAACEDTSAAVEAFTSPHTVEGSSSVNSTPRKAQSTTVERPKAGGDVFPVPVPASVHQSLVHSLSLNSKNETKSTDKRALSRLRSKSRSEVSSVSCRAPLVVEKTRSASNPGTGLFIPRGNYPHLERYVSSPNAVGKARSFLEARSSLYKNRDRVLLPKKKQPSSEMLRRECCFYCRNWYNVRDNPRGSCREAPDPVEKVIRCVTCYPLAQGAVYHCCREYDEVPASIGRYGQGYNVCSCGPAGMSKWKRARRWLLLAMLSLVVPCLCCYLPAHSLYSCCCRGRRGRHKACPNPSEHDQLVRQRPSQHFSRLSF